MQVTTLQDLPAEPARVVIVNVGTELVTTLSLGSALRHASMPVLVVNCDAAPASREHFERLMEVWDFDVMEAPLRPHGIALDAIFSEIKAELVLKLDSDAEIRDPDFVAWMVRWFDNPRVFGSGFVEAPWWLTEKQRAPHRVGFYGERPWTQCMTLRTAYVREAMSKGVSFEARVIYNDFRPSQTVSRFLARRFIGDPRAPRTPALDKLSDELKERLRQAQLPRLRWARGDFYGKRPNYVYNDMGADMLQFCKNNRAWVFAGLPLPLLDDQVFHFGGVTRLALRPWQTNGTRLADIEGTVRRRLAEHYGVVYDHTGQLLSAATVN